MSSVEESSQLRLEVVVLPVSDVDRAKAFYESLGWRLDADFSTDELRVVQLTPPGSQASIICGNNVTSAEPGSVEALQLTVADIDAARDELMSAGADVSEVFHDSGDGHADYGSYASFSDPDGNTWMLQEIRTRLPGRVTGATYKSPAELAEGLTRPKAAHGKHEERTGEADPEWPAWYARYMVAEQTGEALPS